MKLRDTKWWDNDTERSTATAYSPDIGGWTLGHVGTLFGHPVFTLYLPPPEMPLDEMKRRFVAAMEAALREES